MLVVPSKIFDAFFVQLVRIPIVSAQRYITRHAPIEMKVALLGELLCPQQ
jgi:hypothetical protein